MHVDRNLVLPVYIGDDVTDEDAFKALQDIGVGIVVMDGSRRDTAAHYTLAGTDAVCAFLKALGVIRKRSQAR
jgi:trehalose-phosphatase